MKLALQMDYKYLLLQTSSSDSKRMIEWIPQRPKLGWSNPTVSEKERDLQEFDELWRQLKGLVIHVVNTGDAHAAAERLAEGALVVLKAAAQAEPAGNVGLGEEVPLSRLSSQ